MTGPTVANMDIWPFCPIWLTFPVFYSEAGRGLAGGLQEPGFGRRALPDDRPLRGDPPQPPLPRSAMRRAPAPPHHRLKLPFILTASASSLSAIFTVLHDLRVDGRGRRQYGCEQLVEATAHGGREAVCRHFQRLSSRHTLLDRREKRRLEQHGERGLERRERVGEQRSRAEDEAGDQLRRSSLAPTS